MYAYLMKKRCIDKEVVYALQAQKKIYQDSRRNCVFVAYDNDGKAQYASTRGTSDKQYRGDVLNSNKSFGFDMPGKNNKLYVFESPIDAMSHATLTKFMHKDWKEDNRLSLGGLTDLALDRYLKEHPHIKQIIFCLDNDYKATHPLTGELQNHGQIATRRMAAKYSKQGYDVKRILPTMPYKDFNEQLVSFVQRQQQQADEQDIDCEVAACG